MGETDDQFVGDNPIALIGHDFKGAGPSLRGEHLEFPATVGGGGE